MFEISVANILLLRCLSCFLINRKPKIDCRRYLKRDFGNLSKKTKTSLTLFASDDKCE